METKLQFKDLTPCKVEDISAYKEALDFAFRENEITNIAITGTYGAGKTSVIKTYLDSRKEQNAPIKSLRVSLADFNVDETESTKEHIKNMERKVINQIIHQMDPIKIPFSNFIGKKKVNFWLVVSAVIFAMSWIVSLFHLVFFESFEKIYSQLTGKLHFYLPYFVDNVSRVVDIIVLIFVSGIALGIFIVAQRNKKVFKKIKLRNTEIELFNKKDDSYFDKYLSEIIYIFERSKADCVIFEDLDRHNNGEIFDRLREINLTLNLNKDKPMKFIYVLRDDVFKYKEKTKFFDFILPIVPVVDGSNSYNKIKNIFALTSISKNKSDTLDKYIKDDFLRKTSVYIDDMRVIYNIYNEFIVYLEQIKNEFSNIDHTKMLAMIVYKNLFPTDFSKSQANMGYLSYLMTSKVDWLKRIKTELLEKINLLSDQLEKTNEINEIERINNELVDSNLQYHKANTLEISKIANRYQKEFFSVMQNDFKDVFASDYYEIIPVMVKNGFIDETYKNYLTYQYDNGLSESDSIFVKALYEDRELDFNHQIINPGSVKSFINNEDYSKKATINLSLLKYLFENNYYDEVAELIKTAKKYKAYSFILDSLHMLDSSIFVDFIYSTWWSVVNDAIADGFDNSDVTYLINCIFQYSSLEEISRFNYQNCITNFVSKNFTFQNTMDEKVLKMLKQINVRFENIYNHFANFIDIYEGGLYQVNAQNIDAILEFFGFFNLNITQSPTTFIVITDELKFLKEKILRHPKEFLGFLFKYSNVYMELDEGVDFALTLFKKAKMNPSTYIENLFYKVESLKKITTHDYYYELLQLNKVDFTIDNILQYFSEIRMVDPALENFINENVNTKDYLEYSEKVNSRVLNVFFTSALHSNMEENAIIKLINATEFKFKLFRGLDLPMHRIRSLIEYEVIPFNQKQLDFFRNNGFSEEMFGYYIRHYFKSYISLVSKEGVEPNEIISLINSGWFAISREKRLVDVSSGPISIKELKRDNKELVIYIIRNKFDNNDYSFLRNKYKFDKEIAEELEKNFEII